MRTTINVPLSSAWQLRPYLTFLDDVGVPWQSSAGRIGLPTCYPDAAGFIPSRQYGQFLAEMARREGIADLAVRVSLGRDGRLQLFQPEPKLVTACLSAPTLYSGLRAVCTAAGALWTHLSFWLSETEHHTWLCSKALGFSGAAGLEQSNQSRMLQTVALLQRFLGYKWQPAEVHLECRALPGALFSELLGGPRLYTGRPHSAIPIPKSALLAAGPLSSSGLSSSDNDPGDGEINQWNWLQRLRAILPVYIVSARQPTIALVAEIASVHARTLQRVLAAEGISFSELLDQARYDVARRWLADTSAPIAEIGGLLGYTEATNFTRAFHRISGHTPSQYRLWQKGFNASG